MSNSIECCTKRFVIYSDLDINFQVVSKRSLKPCLLYQPLWRKQLEPVLKSAKVDWDVSVKKLDWSNDDKWYVNRYIDMKTCHINRLQGLVKINTEPRKKIVEYYDKTLHTPSKKWRI